ncbi:type II toxin-antitoxin system PemK/MazF family toxin [Ornithinimicrobium sp. EGI L100131]|nr:type II toxin-antitoxin system PemK/MazF family toxin [Ornithinimicrobium sediminis]
MLSRDAAIARRSRVLIAPCTTTFRGLPSEVELVPATDPVPRPCVATLDAVESVPVSLLVDRLGRLSQARLQDLCAALAVAVDCPASLVR